jgi:hypothetical protein
MAKMGRFLKFFSNTYRNYELEQKERIKSLYSEVITNRDNLIEKAKEALLLADQINGNGKLEHH